MHNHLHFHVVFVYSYNWFQWFHCTRPLKNCGVYLYAYSSLLNLSIKELYLNTQTSLFSPISIGIYQRDYFLCEVCQHCFLALEPKFCKRKHCLRVVFFWTILFSDSIWQTAKPFCSLSLLWQHAFWFSSFMVTPIYCFLSVWSSITSHPFLILSAKDSVFWSFLPMLWFLIVSIICFLHWTLCVRVFVCLFCFMVCLFFF